MAATMEENDYTALRCAIDEAHEQDEDMLRRGVAVWRALAEAASVIAGNVPRCHERDRVIALLKQAGAEAGDLIVRHGVGWP